MWQRYRVFLIDRPVSIYEGPDLPVTNEKELRMVFTDSQALVKAFGEFCAAPDTYRAMVVDASGNFEVACEALNKLFKRIEAAGGIVRNPKGDYLLIKRYGFWDLPKGKIEPGESREEAALREVNEETGLTDLTITKKLDSTFHIYTDRKGQEKLKETFWFEMMCNKEQQPVPQTEEDITEATWISPEELPTALENTFESLKGLWEMYFQS